MDLVFEHHRAVGLLVANGLVGSAFALIRVVFESYIRGLWIDLCANEAQLKKFENDKLDVSFGKMIGAVEKTDGFDSQVLSQVKSCWWSPMNSYTHSGFVAVSRRINRDEISAVYDDSEILEALNFVDTISQLALGYVALLAHDQTLADAVLKKMGGSGSE